MAETKVELNKTALLVIDMQNSFVKDKEGFFAELYKLLQSNRVVDNIAKVIKAARRVGIPIMYTKAGHRKDHSDVAQTIIDLEPSKKMSIIVEGTPEAEIVDELKPSADDYIITKRRHGAFYNTDLELLLRSRRLDTLIVTGVLTDACVADTVTGARERDFHVIILSDCCASMTKERHEYWISNVFPRKGRVRTSDEIVAVLAG